MQAVKRCNRSISHSNLIKFRHYAHCKRSFSETSMMEGADDDENCLYLQVNEKKHVLVMGIFHHCYASTMIVQNAINTLKPDTVFLELCPWRGLKLEKIQTAYCKAYHYSPRDVESAAIFSANKLNANIIYGDVPEPVIRAELKKYDENMFKQLENTPISMNEFEFYNHDKTDIFVQTDKNGKQYIIDSETGEQHDAESRAGVRALMRMNNEKHLSKDVQRILYEDREKYMIKAMVEAPKSDKMIAIVGMAHLDGIEKHWKDQSFWEDKEFWSMKYPEPNKWEVKRYNRLLSAWFQDNFDRVPRFVPKWLKMGGD